VIGNGQLGNGGKSNANPLPLEIAGFTGATKVAIASTHACAVKADGSVWCRGSNAAGELGNGESGSGAFRLTAMLVQGSAR
jgi:alpha-tubulin suppressor-like RCC1 family protein